MRAFEEHMYEHMTAASWASSVITVPLNSSQTNFSPGAHWPLTPKFGLCRGDGKIKPWSVPDPPEPLAHVLTNLSTSSRQFLRDIRHYNCSLCMASMQVTEIQFPTAEMPTDILCRCSYAGGGWRSVFQARQSRSDDGPAADAGDSQHLPVVTLKWL